MSTRFTTRWQAALLLLALPLACFGQAAPKSSPDEPVALIGGAPIFEKDLAPLIGPQLLQLRSQEYQVKSRALENLIRERLVEAEAKKQGLTGEKLLEQQVDAKVTAPTEKEAQAYYDSHKAQLNRPYETIKTQLLEALNRAKIQTAREAYADSLRKKAGVEVLLRPPRVEVSYDPERVRGNPKAPVTIVEFSDFQCPFCTRADPVLKGLLAKYDGRVKLAYRDFPLREIHNRAQAAAEASRCAGEQGKFWDYHDLLFANPSKLDEAGLVEHARSLKLDEKTFASCLKGGKFKDKVEADFQEGSKAGISGTPGFFINGIPLVGAQPESAFVQIIDAELAALAPPRPAP